MEIVKSAIFSALGESVVGARVLDLFAGSGALGIEALSRGAASVTFIEKEPAAVAAIRQNLTKTRFTAAILQSDIFSYLDRRGHAADFDLIFADPPYAKRPGERDFATVLASPALPRALSPGGVFVLEHLPSAELPLRPPWVCTRDKRYGATAVAFLMVPP
jgi:16S rRNA (guanine966-N2)-methyltransferase